MAPLFLNPSGPRTWGLESFLKEFEGVLGGFRSAIGMGHIGELYVVVVDYVEPGTREE